MTTASSFSFAFAFAVAFTLALARGPRYSKESASLCFIREVFPNLAIIGKDGAQVSLIEHIAPKPVFRDEDCVVVLKVVHEVDEVVIFILVGVSPVTACSEDKAWIIPFIVDVGSRWARWSRNGSSVSTISHQRHRIREVDVSFMLTMHLQSIATVVFELDECLFHLI